MRLAWNRRLAETLRIKVYDDRLQEISTEHKIADLLSIYCRGIDRYDAELVKYPFRPGAYDSHDVDAGPHENSPIG